MTRHRKPVVDTLLTALDNALSSTSWQSLKKVWRANPTNENWWAMYNSYLLSDEWDAKREQVLAHDHHRCRLCSSGAALQVHHPPIAYRDIGNENIDDLSTLCEPCHTSVTILLRGRAKAKLRR